MTISRRDAVVMALASAYAPGAMAAPMASKSSPLQRRIDWPTFLARHDLVWDRLPQAWDEGPFMGNGMLGLMIYQDPETGALRLDLGRSDVEDHRGPETGGTGHRFARLPIGHFQLETAGQLTGAGSLRLDLWQAETRANVVTDKGRITLRAYVHAIDEVIVVETTGEGGEANCRWTFVGEQADSPRQTFGIKAKEARRIDPRYKSNPPGRVTRQGETWIWEQPLLAGGLTATAWREATTAGTRRLLVNVSHSVSDTSARPQALARVNQAALGPAAKLSERHRVWWRTYYPKSFLSFSDTRWESFYWIQMYKLASATRAERALIDNQGPWLQATAWPYATWNLNVQLTYWPVYASNRLDLGLSLTRTLDRYRQDLIDNVPPAYRADSAGMGRSSGTTLASRVGVPGKLTNAWGDGANIPPEVGLLTWALHNVWLQYRYSMDEVLLRNLLFPLLRRSINYYRHFLTTGPDGKLHLPDTYSPEYGTAPDCNFDLALLRWGCETLLKADKILGTHDPLARAWRDVLDRLVDYPRDANGYLIGAGVPYAYSHRHYSHMLMVYPLHLVNTTQPGAADVVQTSLDFWQSKPEQLQGYSCTGAASISASLGKGDQALNYLNRLRSGFLRPNTLYRESGPVIETPLSGAQSIHDMILQSWGETLRIFPAVPSTWPDVVFDTLRGEGGFLVSAERRGGVTQWIEVESLAGQPLRIVTDIPSPFATVDGHPVSLTRAGGGVSAPLAKGQKLRLSLSASGQPSLQPVAARAQDVNTYGLNARSPSYAPLDRVVP